MSIIFHSVLYIFVYILSLFKMGFIPIPSLFLRVGVLHGAGFSAGLSTCVNASAFALFLPCTLSCVSCRWSMCAAGLLIGSPLLLAPAHSYKSCPVFKMGSLSRSGAWPRRTLAHPHLLLCYLVIVADLLLNFNFVIIFICFTLVVTFCTFLVELSKNSYLVSSEDHLLLCLYSVLCVGHGSQASCSRTQQVSGRFFLVFSFVIS